MDAEYGIVCWTEEDKWHDSRERFAYFCRAWNHAASEFGVPWIVVRLSDGAPLAYGDVGGTTYAPDVCPDCGLSSAGGFGQFGCEGCGT